jgi:hypothetical protein
MGRPGVRTEAPTALAPATEKADEPAKPRGRADHQPRSLASCLLRPGSASSRPGSAGSRNNLLLSDTGAVIKCLSRPGSAASLRAPAPASAVPTEGAWAPAPARVPAWASQHSGNRGHMSSSSEEEDTMGSHEPTLTRKIQRSVDGDAPAASAATRREAAASARASKMAAVQSKLAALNAIRERSATSSSATAAASSADAASRFSSAAPPRATAPPLAPSAAHIRSGKIQALQAKLTAVQALKQQRSRCMYAAEENDEASAEERVESVWRAPKQHQLRQSESCGALEPVAATRAMKRSASVAPAPIPVSVPAPADEERGDEEYVPLHIQLLREQQMLTEELTAPSPAPAPTPSVEVEGATRPRSAGRKKVTAVVRATTANTVAGAVAAVQARREVEALPTMAPSASAALRGRTKVVAAVKAANAKSLAGAAEAALAKDAKLSVAAHSNVVAAAEVPRPLAIHLHLRHLGVAGLDTPREHAPATEHASGKVALPRPLATSLTLESLDIGRGTCWEPYVPPRKRIGASITRGIGSLSGLSASRNVQLRSARRAQDQGLVLTGRQTTTLNAAGAEETGRARAQAQKDARRARTLNRQLTAQEAAVLNAEAAERNKRARALTEARQATARGLVSHAFRPGAWDPLQRADVHSRPGMSSWQGHVFRRQRKTREGGRRAQLSESYVRRLVSQHTLLVVLCQPYPPDQTHESIDMEQIVQCFWSALLTQLAVVATLASEQGIYGHELSLLEVTVDAFSAAGIGAAVGLIGCRAIFLWSGPAGRNKLKPEKDRELITCDAPPCCFKLCDCKCNPSSPELRSRVLRASIGWSWAAGVFISASAVAAHHMQDMTRRKLTSLFGAWVLAQLASWVLMEPVGILLLPPCVVAMCKLWKWSRRKKTMVQPVDTSSNPDRVRDQHTTRMLRYLPTRKDVMRVHPGSE